MRSALVLLFALALAPACGGGSDPAVGDDDDDDDDGSAVDAGDDTTDTFRIESPDIEILQGAEQTFCYYTTIDLDEPVAVKQWSSRMSQGSHHLILYFLPPSSGEPDGTVVEDCDIGFSGSGLPQWTYSAQTAEQTFDLPSGIGMTVGARQKVVVQMHYLNPSSEPIQAHVEVTGRYFSADESFIHAAPYITYNTQIEIPEGIGSTDEVSGSCDVPAGAKFFTLSTHAHRRAVETRVRDLGDDSMVFESDDWEHPGAVNWTAEPFYEFGGKLEYHCAYVNDQDDPVVTGSSAATNEMCMAVGYFFPAEQPIYCINSFTFGG